MQSTPNKQVIYKTVCERYQEWYGAEHMKGGSCLYWSTTLASVLVGLGYRALIQAGSVYWPILPKAQDDGKRPTHFSYEWSPWREESQAALKLGLLPEIHVWVGLPDSKEIVDFSTKYFPQHAAVEGLKWRTPPPPDFLWCGPDELPEGVIYRPKIDAIQFILKRIQENQT